MLAVESLRKIRPDDVSLPPTKLELRMASELPPCTAMAAPWLALSDPSLPKMHPSRTTVPPSAYMPAPRAESPLRMQSEMLTPDAMSVPPGKTWIAPESWLRRPIRFSCERWSVPPSETTKKLGEAVTSDSADSCSNSCA